MLNCYQPFIKPHFTFYFNRVIFIDTTSINSLIFKHSGGGIRMLYDV